MAATAKSYFLAPNWNYQKHGPLSLGDIISDPSDPVFSKLSSFATTPTLALPKIYDNPPEQWSRVDKRSSDYEFNIFARFLESLGVGLGAGSSASSSHHAERSFTMDSMQTSYFVPDSSYVISRLKDPNVSVFLDSRGIFQSKNLYVITGVKLAKNLVVRTTSGADTTLGADAEVSLLPVGFPISVGSDGKVSWGREDQITVSQNAADVEVVFAYQLRRIRVKGKAGQERSESKSWNKGAFLNQEGQRGRSDRDVSDLSNVDDFEIGSHDVRLADVESDDFEGDCGTLHEKDVIDEGEQCKLIVKSSDE